MTAISQTSVCSKRHLANIRTYLDWDREKALGLGEDEWGAL